MKKNDKLVVLLGVIILVIASIGIYYGVPTEPEKIVSVADDFVKLTGVLSDELPTAIYVPDSNPFYAIVATPVAIHYDAECNQYVIPLLVQNLTNPSDPVVRAKEQIGIVSETVFDDSMDAKEFSLFVADKYWESSKAALIIENNQSGYELGVLATPLASYLSIPVIVTDEMDQDVVEILNDLGVEYTMVCGDTLEGYGHVLKFEAPEQIVDVSMEIIEQKFKTADPSFDINYLTITNPIDAWPPKVLDRKEIFLPERTIKSMSMSQIFNTATGLLTGQTYTTWTFTIPEDYKYALIKFWGYNHDAEDAETMGDGANFNIGPNLPDLPAGQQKFELLAGGKTSSSGVAIRDNKGNILKDMVYSEMVVYDRGGVEYVVEGSGSWLVKKQGTISGKVVIEKLENPRYPLMKGLSSIAPYLTAYRKGIMYGKPDFAFTADDDVITDDGKTCPGLYIPRKNPSLIPLSNKHIYYKVHQPINKVLAKLASIDYNENDRRDLRILREYYKENPIYIALVGGTMGLPQYIYQNNVEPFGDFDGDGVDDTPWFFGGGTPSDNIYGNIDPIEDDWSNMANDIYSDNEFPYQENIVGRITGWDVQDASALIARTVFYQEIINKLEEWRDNFGLMIGGGQDFQEPLIRYMIFGDLLGMVSHGEPMKMDTGYGEMVFMRTEAQVAKPMEFEVKKALFEHAQLRGFSEESLDRIKKANLINRFLFLKPQIRKLVGENVVKGQEILESCNFIFANGHGCQHFFGMAGNDLTAAGLGGPLMHFLLKQTIIPILGGFIGPGGDLSNVGDYTTRAVENLKLGPSFMWLESCFCGKIDGIDPETNIGQAFMHAGLNALIASSTGSNIGGGYLEPKNMKYDIPPIPALKYITQKQKWKKGIFDQEPHFGLKIYTDLCNELKENDASIGEAFLKAKNNYLPSDKDWELWWSPPLIRTGIPSLDMEIAKGNTKDFYRVDREMSSGKGPMLPSKYVTYQEYLLFGDPAFNPYEPINNG